MSELGLTAVLVIALVLTFGVVVILLLIIWSIKRHRDPDLHIECDSPSEDLIPSLAGLTLAPTVDGNTIEIFENGAPAVKILHHTMICLARKRIWIQNPYFIPEPEAIAAFGAAVKRGVDVRVMMPSTGGPDNPMGQHAGHRCGAACLSSNTPTRCSTRR